MDASRSRRFETVEIHEYQRNNRPVCFSLFDLIAQRLVEIAPVIQAGQNVLHGLLAEELLAGAQRLFSLFAFGNVDHGNDDARQRILMTEKRQGFAQNALFVPF